MVPSDGPRFATPPAPSVDARDGTRPIDFDVLIEFRKRKVLTLSATIDSSRPRGNWLAAEPQACYIW
jgi:hypothetical protein